VTVEDTVAKSETAIVLSLNSTVEDDILIALIGNSVGYGTFTPFAFSFAHSNSMLLLMSSMRCLKSAIL
jgi:hypothetical protein